MKAVQVFVQIDRDRRRRSVDPVQPRTDQAAIDPCVEISHRNDRISQAMIFGKSARTARPKIGVAYNRRAGTATLEPSNATANPLTVFAKPAPPE
ncbi:hypothetical protein L3067_07455 [Xanthomonas sp. PPL568]|uniref:hypothetical protein n=1 Tax=Xanthomonas indica TaxID=2912242 RepID=UPI001F597D1D|nr:hypothetical protein [Xanthomonas indica]MCI2244448.1 hypothetical protein [Xanthomonas indica]